jgi:predicted GNAT family N-acyltransferase
MRQIGMEKPLENGQSLKLHSPFYPEDIRESDLISCRVKIADTWVSAKVFRISPLGVELVKTSEVKFLSVGQLVDLEIKLDMQKSSHTGVVVDVEYTEGTRNLVGIRLVSVSKNEPFSAERRKEQRFFSAPSFLPTASAPNPLRYNDILIFRAKELSASGLFLVTSLRNKFLMKDIELDLLLCLPVFGNVTVPVKIENIRIIREEGKEFLGVGVSIIGSSLAYKKIAGSYIMQFSEVNSSSELKNAGFPVEEFGKTIDFRYVKTESDYREVLSLRKLAYTAEGKANIEDPDESLATALDSKARIIMAYFKGKLVASAAVIFHDESSLTEHEEFSDCTKEMPTKDQMVEINRVCTHPDFRRSDLFLQLYRFLLILIVQSKRRYVTICATKDLAKLYQKLGFDLTEIQYVHPKLNNIPHYLLKCDVYKKVSGHGVGPLTWNFVLDSILPTLIRHAKDKGIQLDMTRIKIYLCFRPFMQLMQRINGIRRAKRVPKQIAQSQKAAA